ncbi:hypothetical protein Tco_1216205 [Tanacetum coccineum]
MDSRLVVPAFLPFDDLIASLNKAMAFISTTFTSRYPPTKNQLRTSANLKNQATIQDGRVTGLTEMAELTHQVRKRLFIATAVKRKAIWQDCVLNLKGQGIQHGLNRM